MSEEMEEKLKDNEDLKSVNLSTFGCYDLSKQFDLSSFYDRTRTASRSILESTCNQLAAHIARNTRQSRENREAVKLVDEKIAIMEKNRYRKRIGIGAVISHLTSIKIALEKYV